MHRFNNKIIKKKLTHLYQTMSEIEQQLDEIQAAKHISIDSLIELTAKYESISKEVYFLRAQSNIDIDSIEDRLNHMSQRLHFLSTSGNETKGLYKEIVTKYRRLWRDHGQLFILSLFCFSMSIIFGWAISYQFPEYTSLFIPDRMIEAMINGSQWFDEIKDSPILSGISIALNNIKVCIFAYLLGIIFGIGGLYILVFNGAMVGSLLGASYQYSFNENINGFISSHGPLELTLIIASCFASFIYGQSFYKRPYKNIYKRLRHTIRESLFVVIPLTFWLCVAALFEVLVSPFDYMSDHNKLLSGVVIAIIFWVWTFWPTEEVSQ